MRGAVGILLLICLPLVMVTHLLAQETGQVCVRSFEDRDGDGLRDPDERTIARGVSAGLRNRAGVTIASRLLEDSPFAADGLLCFDRVLAGDYQIALRSAEFSNTTSAVFEASVSPGEAPALVEFGLQPLQMAEASGASRTVIDAALVDAVLRGLAGGLILITLMSLIGLLLYFAFFLRRLTRVRAKPYRARPSGDALREPAPGGGSAPLFAEDNTDAAAAT